MHKKLCFIGWLAALLLLVGCQPKTDLDKIDVLKKQVNKDVKALNELYANTIVQLEKDFIACDSSLQFMPEEKLDVVFPKLQLVDAYIQQFKMERPVMQAEMDSTLARLDLLRADAETHYLADSLVAGYIEDETQQVEKLSNQVEYFKDRLGNCRKDLESFKKKK
jgi:LPS O-antigen subunit length determinant protein (WzzB/FepE family)